MIVYQPTDAPRYFKANKGLLVICFWMCVSSKFCLSLHRPTGNLTMHAVHPIPGDLLLLQMEEQPKGQRMGRDDPGAAGQLSEDDH